MTVLHEAPVVPSQSAAARSWLRRIYNGGQIIETCPKWCTDRHANDHHGHLDDLQHGARFDGPLLPVFDAEQGTLPVPILAGRLSVDPYSDDPRRRVPHVHLEPFADEVMECLEPDDLAAVIVAIEAHCGQMRAVHAQLVRARAEYL